MNHLDKKMQECIPCDQYKYYCFPLAFRLAFVTIRSPLQHFRLLLWFEVFLVKENNINMTVLQKGQTAQALLQGRTAGEQ